MRPPTLFLATVRLNSRSRDTDKPRSGQQEPSTVGLDRSREHFPRQPDPLSSPPLSPGGNCLPVDGVARWAGLRDPIFSPILRGAARPPALNSSVSSAGAVLLYHCWPCGFSLARFPVVRHAPEGFGHAEGCPAAAVPVGCRDSLLSIIPQCISKGR
jgi:hypothetical protein